MKKVATILLLLLFGVAASAQSWELIKEDTNTYLWGEGWAETLDEADQQALASLISKISIVVVSDFEMLEGENASKGDYEHYVESKISTFSQATLTNTEMVVLSNEPDAHVGRWIKRSEIDRIFEGRRNKVMEFVENAERAEGKAHENDVVHELTEQCGNRRPEEKVEPVVPVPFLKVLLDDIDYVDIDEVSQPEGKDRGKDRPGTV